MTSQPLHCRRFKAYFDRETTPDETADEAAGADARATHAPRFMAARHDFNRHSAIGK
jgi:hypothetical protein